MKHIRAINQKARLIEERFAGAEDSVGPLAERIPFGCSTQLAPGWEVDSGGGTYGLCTPIERDLYDCYHSCYWPAQVPDALTNFADWSRSCGAPVQDWSSIDLVFP
ncbi:MAG TPA: quinohemoprotein amine dehydrogenase [Planctomycetes bacterium]|jgi:hypothetical protein|nr:quinohemoprotein amine dehydrogenase [Planctomycetota bacterium]